MPNAQDPNQVLSTQPLIQTPQQIHQQTADQIQGVLKDVYGEEHSVLPTTAETPVEGDSAGEFIDRVVYNRAGFEPSKGFLKKMVERLKKKNPGADIKYKDK